MSTLDQNSLEWIGCGKTALLALPGSGREGTGPQEDALVNDFTASGGVEFILETGSISPAVRGCGEVPGLDTLSELIGEAGDPGDCSGLYELAGRDEIGTVVLPPVAAEAAGLLEDFALQHPRLLFCCQVPAEAGLNADGRERAGLRRPLPNLAILETRLPGNSSAAALAGYLEARDFFPLRTPSALDRSNLAIRSGAGREEDSFPFPGELRALVTWRRRQGLRRSLEAGTRWAVFEYASSALLRRVERQTRAFLHSLAVDGFLPFRNGFELKVSMEGRQQGDTDGFDRRLSIGVRTRFDARDGVEVEQVLPAASVVVEESTV